MTKPSVHSRAAPADLDDALGRIREHGGRVTEGKRALTELLFDHDGWMTAEEITAALKGHDRSAVYRNLNQLQELGIVEHLHLGHGRAVYRLAGQPTVPVLCSTCGATFALDRSETAAFARRVRERTGVALDLTHFPLTGTCAACASSGGSDR